MLNKLENLRQKLHILLITGLIITASFDIMAEPNSDIQIKDDAVVHDASIIEPQPSIKAPESWNIHGQYTYVNQRHPSFDASYSGTYSLDSYKRQSHTNDVTLFVGIRLWQGAEFYVNPEYDEGFGLSNTQGVAGFPSGEAYKVGKNHPYFKWQRAFLRQIINLGGKEQSIESSANQLAGSKTSNHIILTAGKFSVVDIFDTNIYAHDPRSDFLNWSILDAGAFDYAADAWAYTYGLAGEWTQSWWTVRGGLFALSELPNTTKIQKDFSQYSLIAEVEERHQWLGHPGKLKLFVFDNRGRMAKYDDAVQLANQTGSIPDPALSRHFTSRAGMGINLEQELTSTIGLFGRASFNDGSKEAFDFTDINQSISGGLLIKGNSWGRPYDTFGIAGAINGISDAARQYFAAGGLGILIGDGQLIHYSSERIFETFYSFQLNQYAKMSLNYQYVVNPAYNQDRGPVSLFGMRFHAEF